MLCQRCVVYWATFCMRDQATHAAPELTPYPPVRVLCRCAVQAMVGGGLALGWGGVNWLLRQQSSNKSEHC